VTRYWTRQRTIAAIRAWATQHGRPPTSTEWAHAAPEHPDASTVHRLFGGWTKGVAAAGIESAQAKAMMGRLLRATAKGSTINRHAHARHIAQTVLNAQGGPR
jgi:hypothetical protein